MSEGRMEKTKSVAYPDISAGLPHIGNMEYSVDGKIFRITVAPPFCLFTAFSQHTRYPVLAGRMTNGARWVQNSGTGPFLAPKVVIFGLIFTGPHILL